nr:hypothetical protein [Gordonia sp. NB41Y]
MSGLDGLVEELDGGRLRALIWILVVLLVAAAAAGAGWWVGARLLGG